MPLRCVILDGGGNADLRHDPQSVPKFSHSRTRVVCRQENCHFIEGGDTLSKKVMEDLSSAEHKSVIDESSSIVFSLLKCECVGDHCQTLSERVRRLCERVLQKGLECSRRATQMAESSIERRSRSSPHRWCGKEDAFTELPLVIRDSQGNFTADPQCVA